MAVWPCAAVLAGVSHRWAECVGGTVSGGRARPTRMTERWCEARRLGQKSRRLTVHGAVCLVQDSVKQALSSSLVDLVRSGVSCRGECLASKTCTTTGNECLCLSKSLNYLKPRQCHYLVSRFPATSTMLSFRLSFHSHFTRSLAAPQFLT